VFFGHCELIRQHLARPPLLTPPVVRSPLCDTTPYEPPLNPCPVLCPRCVALWRWVYDKDWTFLKLAFPLSNYIIMMISWDVRKKADGQGIGRHSQEDVMAIGQADLKALSDFLGEAFVLLQS